MASYIPEAVRISPLDELIMEAGLKLEYMGKVRNCYGGLEDPSLRLTVVTDRRSIYDFVLGFTIPDIGAVLNALNIHWTSEVRQDGPDDLVASGCLIDKFLPSGLSGDYELRSRATIVRVRDVIPIEAIVRGYLVGSGWQSYRDTGRVCGHKLPAGLWEGCQLPQRIFTPSTKAETGHDEHVSVEAVRQQYPWMEARSVRAFNRISEAMEREGYLLADTKFEFGSDGTLVDERGTPDSSRIWLKSDWEVARADRRPPASHDKQYLRDAGRLIETPFGVTGIHQLDPADPEHQQFVGSVQFPEEVIARTRAIYLDIFWGLTGYRLPDYLRDCMRVLD